MTEPCIKKQSKRPYKYSTWAWCSCGHNAVHHNYGVIFGRYSKGACQDCICSKFDFIADYTYGTIDTVPVCKEDEKNESKN